MDYYAKPSKRALGAIIDYVLIYTAFFIYIFTFGQPNAEGERELHGNETLPIIGLWFLYFPVIEGIAGQT